MFIYKLLYNTMYIKNNNNTIYNIYSKVNIIRLYYIVKYYNMVM